MFNERFSMTRLLGGGGGGRTRDPTGLSHIVTARNFWYNCVGVRKCTYVYTANIKPHASVYFAVGRGGGGRGGPMKAIMSCFPFTRIAFQWKFYYATWIWNVYRMRSERILSRTTSTRCRWQCARFSAIELWRRTDYLQPSKLILILVVWE